jgi:hypothetical protein
MASYWELVLTDDIDAVDRALAWPACGLVALGRPATASSHGLKWNLGAGREV